MKNQSRFVFACAMLSTLLGSTLPAHAEDKQSEIYQVTLINVLPNALHQGNTVDSLFKELHTTLEKEPGIVDVKVTQQVGAQYNFTVIEQWKDQASLDASNASSENEALDERLKPLLSGPVYRRVFSVFE